MIVSHYCSTSCELQELKNCDTTGLISLTPSLTLALPIVKCSIPVSLSFV